MSRIEKGQVYESCQPVRPETPGTWDKPAPQPRHVRIKVTGNRIPPLNTRGAGKVEVATVLPDGRLVRKRLVNASELHDSATTSDGKPRKTGYRLVTDTEDSA